MWLSSDLVSAFDVLGCWTVDFEFGSVIRQVLYRLGVATCHAMIMTTSQTRTITLVIRFRASIYRRFRPPREPFCDAVSRDSGVRHRESGFVVRLKSAERTAFSSSCYASR